MRILGNIIWHIPFLGFLFALAYALGGLFFCITIIGIPIGLGWLQFSLFLLSPFSRAMVSREDLELLTGQKQGDAMHAFSFIVRILYFPFGLLATIGALCTIVAEFISLIGIPSGIVWAKSLSTIFNPVNKVCVPRAVAMEIERRKNEGTLNKYTSGNVSSISNHTTDGSGAVQNKYMERVMQKSDEELKELIQQKDDFNPELIKAAEKVLLARVTGTEVVMDEPIPQTVPYVNTNSFDFENLKGDTLVMIGVLLPCFMIITNIITSILLKYQILGTESYVSAIISLLLHLAGIFLIFNGRLKMKEEKPEVKNTGVTLILIGSCLMVLGVLRNMIFNYLIHNNICNITYDALYYTEVIPVSLYTIATISGVILWKCSDKEKNTMGLSLICLETVLSSTYIVFCNPIAQYIYDNYGNPLVDVIMTSIFLFIIILKILAWYIFVGPNKYASNAIYSDKN